MNAVQNVFSSQVVIDCFDDAVLDEITSKIINSEEIHQWLEEANPYALEEMARRMLELHSRGRWNPDKDVLEKLKESYLIIEGDMEARTESSGDIQGGNVEIVTDKGIGLWRRQMDEIERELGKTDKKETNL